jgi:two-component system cell cycle sensor histidine kinase/response regulator CckA
MVVLVVDDNEASRFVISVVLERAGHETLEADNAEDAFRICRAQQVDLLISDAILRQAQGTDVARRLREAFPSLPVLFISGYPLQQLVARGLLEADEVGPRRAGFLQKPFLPEALLTAVKTLSKARA